jgi:hypothetical protein
MSSAADHVGRDNDARVGNGFDPTKSEGEVELHVHAS